MVPSWPHPRSAAASHRSASKVTQVPVEEFVRSPDDSNVRNYVKSDTAGHNFNLLPAESSASATPHGRHRSPPHGPEIAIAIRHEPATLTASKTRGGPVPHPRKPGPSWSTCRTTPTLGNRSSPRQRTRRSNEEAARRVVSRATQQPWLPAAGAFTSTIAVTDDDGGSRRH